MITCKCEQCGGEFPMSDTLRVADRILCDACCEQTLADQTAPRPNLERQFDPTICANCKRDNGTTELPRLAGLPVCGPCEAFFRNRPFPVWIKAALAAVIVLVAVSLAWNLRFFRAYLAFKRSFVCFAQGQPEAASVQMSSAAACVPECQDLHTLATYMQGVTLLYQNQCAAALAKLTQCKDRLPSRYGVESLILQARGGAAFDAKDYDGFLAAAQTLDQQAPAVYMNKATLASALACKYAQTGDAGFRERALECLGQAKTLARGDPQFQEYETRIRHRLHSRQILTPEEFHERFPDGWSGQKEE